MWSLGRGCSLRTAGATQGAADVVEPLTSDNYGTVDPPVVVDGDGPATPYTAAPLAGAPVIQRMVNPAIPDAVTPASSRITIPRFQALMLERAMAIR